MTDPQRRALNDQVTRFWGSVAKAYDWGPLQRNAYQQPHDEMLALLRERGAQKILDVACGTGILADRIQRELDPDEIDGVDMSEGMLARAKALSDKVRWQIAPAEQLPFEDGGLDAVVTTSAFHFFNQAAALREFHRVLRPGGIAAVTTISPRQPVTPLLNRLVPQQWSATQFLPPDQIRALFEDAGFTIAEQRRVRRPAWSKAFAADLFTVGVKG
ncbi:MAG: class I SAM-dependent methyltransferase [Segniliparus sp.]|uniref:class I SAM-dependent methyltransferase n=1 Tax=Segniliparus sp. TaxID=2804064 RepID=UPI003F362C93